jgi:hypothetical protein
VVESLNAFDDFNVQFNELNIKLQNFRIHLVRYLAQAAGRLGQIHSQKCKPALLIKNSVKTSSQCNVIYGDTVLKKLVLPGW